MSNNFFKILRAGVNTTFQDKGRNNLYHIGIPFSGAMDNRNYLLANKLAGNKLDLPIIEFAYQGPLLKFYGDKINIVITGDVVFKLKQQDKEFDGNCYETYQLENEDEINILSTNKSVYGYLAISGTFDLKLHLPIHLCRMANLLLPLVMVSRSYLFYEILFYQYLYLIYQQFL